MTYFPNYENLSTSLREPETSHVVLLLYVTRSEVDLRLIDFLVPCVIFNAWNDPVTYTNRRRLHGIQKFSQVSRNDSQQPFRDDWDMAEYPVCWREKAWSPKKSNHLIWTNYQGSCEFLLLLWRFDPFSEHGLPDLLPPTFLVASCCLRFPCLEQIDGFPPNIILPSTSMLSHWPSSSETSFD
jgi:hypothetical protein